MSDGYDSGRKMSHFLLSLEEKMNTLIKTIAVQDMNNKLILDRLNKLFQRMDDGQSIISPAVTPKISSSTTPSKSPLKEIEKISHSVTVKDLPLQFEEIKKQSNKKNTEDQDNRDLVSDSQSKIPVSQRITDQQGKDLFMADIVITNANKEIVARTKTTAVGKWNAYLSPGKYSVQMIKIIDGNSLQKIEANQEIEVKAAMKSLQLPTAIVKR